MTRISSEEASRPKGTTFHSNWPSCYRKLVFHRSAVQIELGEKATSLPLSSASMCWSGSTAGRVMALRSWGSWLSTPLTADFGPGPEVLRRSWTESNREFAFYASRCRLRAWP